MRSAAEHAQCYCVSPSRVARPLAIDVLEDEMVNPTDGTRVASHGMFYMEGAGGCEPELDAPSSLAETHQPSCFGQEEERGSSWEGAGATGRIINDARPTL